MFCQQPSVCLTSNHSAGGGPGVDAGRAERRRGGGVHALVAERLKRVPRLPHADRLPLAVDLVARAYPDLGGGCSIPSGSSCRERNEGKHDHPTPFWDTLETRFGQSLAWRQTKPRLCGAFQADARTRTGDPFMRVLFKGFFVSFGVRRSRSEWPANGTVSAVGAKCRRTLCDSV